MADVSKIKLPDNTEVNIKDSRISGVDSAPTSESTNVVTSGGVHSAISGVEHFYFVQGSSSQAGNSTSGEYLSTKWEGTVPGVSTATNGLKLAYRIATHGGVGTAGVVLSIDGTNYYPVVIQKNTLVTTHYPVGATVLMVFNSTQTASAYLTSNTKTTVTGCWQIMEYDSNTNTYQREYVSSGNVEYPITTRYNTTTGESYYAEYGRYSEGVTLNPSTNTITASKFKVTSGTSSQFLKADGSVDSNTYATTGQIPSAPGTLDTTAATAQSTSSSETLSGNITLHKVAKTGTYSDLIGTPTIPDNIWKWGEGQARCVVVNSSKAGTTAGYDSFSEGYLCDTGGSATSNAKTANASNVAGSCSHAEGNATIAKGLSCHSEGKLTFAGGEGSHAEGIKTHSGGHASHTEGEETKTNNVGEHAGGRYNSSTRTSSTYGDAGNTSFSHGIGTADNARKNALEIMENGDAYLYGVGSYDGTNYSSASTLQSVIGNIPAAVTETTVSGWGFTKNAGTLTGVSFNGTAATVTNGVAAITAPVSNDSTITIQMNGSTVDSFTTNAASAKTINLGTVITSHQDISGKANVATTLSGYGITDATISGQTVTLGSNSVTIPQILSGMADPTSAQGNNGDIYIKLSS